MNLYQAAARQGLVIAKQSVMNTMLVIDGDRVVYSGSLSGAWEFVNDCAFQRAKDEAAIDADRFAPGGSF